MIKSIYGIVQAASFWFKEFIKTVKLKAEFKQCKNDPCLLYIVNELGSLIVIV